MDWTLFGLVPMIFGSAPVADTPRGLLEEIYKPLLAGEHEDIEKHFSPHLQSLVVANLQANAVDGKGTRIDPAAPDFGAFNPFINGETGTLENLAVSEPVIQDGTAVAMVSFTNASKPTVLTISMVQDEGAWKIDDVASVGAGEKWLYSWLLQYDPFGQQ